MIFKGFMIVGKSDRIHRRTRPWHHEGRFTGGIIGHHRHYEGPGIAAILLSLNGDFSHIVNYPPKNYKGIVAMRMHNHSEILPKLIVRLTAYLKMYRS
jgi:hypothetical protein